MPGLTGGKEQTLRKTKKIAVLGLLTAIALTIFMIEAQIPPVVPVPRVKLGLSDLVTVFTLFTV